MPYFRYQNCGGAQMILLVDQQLGSSLRLRSTQYCLLGIQFNHQTTDVNVLCRDF